MSDLSVDRPQTCLSSKSVVFELKHIGFGAQTCLSSESEVSRASRGHGRRILFEVGGCRVRPRLIELIPGRRACGKMKNVSQADLELDRCPTQATTYTRREGTVPVQQVETGFRCCSEYLLRYLVWTVECGAKGITPPIRRGPE